MQPIERLTAIMAQLRNKENGCPWDVEQDFASIAPHTLEEAYEVVDAIERKDMAGLKEELGDLLLQVVFHAQMASEQGLFTFDDVVEGICAKLTTRHPHVFGDAKVKNAAEQVEAWDAIKAKEKAQKGGKPVLFDDIPAALPSMTRALKIQKQAAKLGFDWLDVESIFEKLEEEVSELKYVLAHGKLSDAMREEIGDMIFCCVNMARHVGIDPEEALRGCNRKFTTRFRYMQKELDDQHRDIKDASLQELSDLWDEAKIAEQVPAVEARGGR